MIPAGRYIEALRGWVGTPFAHGQACRGAGCDCIGLVLGAAAEAGAELPLPRSRYSALPDGSLLAIISAHCRALESVRAGALLIFRTPAEPHHIAVATAADTMIHAWICAGRVCETGIDRAWRRRLHSIWWPPYLEAGDGG